MKTIKKEWINWIIILLPFVFIAINWDKFPDRIATHFGIDGQPNDYSSKVTGLILFPGINILMYGLFLIIPLIDPRKQSYNMFEGKWKIIRMVLHLFLSSITVVTAVYSLGYNINIGSVVCYSITILFLILGNYMGNIRSNYFVGIRVPWTLANEEVWNQTHRMAGKVWVFFSLLMLALLYFIPNAEWLLLPYIIIITLVPIVYSFIKYKQLTAEKHS